jgi:hypothetical protein
MIGNIFKFDPIRTRFNYFGYLYALSPLQLFGKDWFKEKQKSQDFARLVVLFRK